MAKKKLNFGGLAFLIGIIIAIFVGLFGTLSKTIIGVLAVLGLIVGLLNIKGKEINTFLLATVSLIIILAFGGTVLSAVMELQNILISIMALVVPAAVIAALKAVYIAAKT